MLNPETKRRLESEGRIKEGRTLPLGAQYIGHCGTKARMRYLKQRYHRIFKLAATDDATERALLRLNSAVEMDPEPDYAVLHLANAALDAAAGTGTTWAEAMNALLDRFVENAKGSNS